jgi:hypothetical protein
MCNVTALNVIVFSSEKKTSFNSKTVLINTKSMLNHQQILLLFRPPLDVIMFFNNVIERQIFLATRP